MSVNKQRTGLEAIGWNGQVITALDVCVCVDTERGSGNDFLIYPMFFFDSNHPEYKKNAFARCVQPQISLYPGTYNADILRKAEPEELDIGRRIYKNADDLKKAAGVQAESVHIDCDFEKLKAFFEIYKDSLHYQARKETRPDWTDIALFGYCPDSDDFVDPRASDAYMVFKAQQEKLDWLLGGIEMAIHQAKSIERNGDISINSYRTIKSKMRLYDFLITLRKTPKRHKSKFADLVRKTLVLEGEARKVQTIRDKLYELICQFESFGITGISADTRSAYFDAKHKVQELQEILF